PHYSRAFPVPLQGALGTEKHGPLGPCLWPTIARNRTRGDRNFFSPIVRGRCSPNRPRVAGQIFRNGVGAAEHLPRGCSGRGAQHGFVSNRAVRGGDQNFLPADFRARFLPGAHDAVGGFARVVPDDAEGDVHRVVIEDVEGDLLSGDRLRSLVLVADVGHSEPEQHRDGGEQPAKTAARPLLGALAVPVGWYLRLRHGWQPSACELQNTNPPLGGAGAIGAGPPGTMASASTLSIAGVSCGHATGAGVRKICCSAGGTTGRWRTSCV